MEYQTLGNFAVFGLLLVLGVVLGIAPVMLPFFIMPRSRGIKTRETYECGVDTIGSAWIRFSIVFYLYALIFLAFEVDVLYIIPVALAYGAPQYGLGAAFEVALFLLILALALIFAWRKGVFGVLTRRRPSRRRANLASPAGAS